MSEFEFIAQLKAKIGYSGFTRLGIGDDCAILQNLGNGELLVTTDMLLSGSHFDLTTTSPQEIGRKSLAVNLSDIAAMAGTPLAAVVALGLPRGFGMERAADLMSGILGLAEDFGMDVIGGDTNSWSGSQLVVSITMLGKSHSKGSVLRSGAQLGDAIFVTGTLGGSLRGRHLSFTPRVDWARRLHDAYDLHAMIDLSDGLSIDVRRIAVASGVCARLFADKIPVANHLLMHNALNDGEDFELCFCLSKEDGERLLVDPAFAHIPLSRIGYMEVGRGAILVDNHGMERELLPEGFEHQF